MALLLALLLALAGHAALLLVPWGPDDRGGAASGTGPRAAQVRVLGPDDAVPARPAAPGSVSTSVTARVATRVVTDAAAERTVAALPAFPASPTSPADAASGPGQATAPVDDEALFLVRSQLDRAPYAPEPIDLPYPESAPLGQHQAVMTLFIDEQGRVRRVRLDVGQMLPPLLEDAARQTFLRARFEPGIKDGAPVRSRLRVAVEFGAEPTPGATPESTPQPTAPPAAPGASR